MAKPTKTRISQSFDVDLDDSSSYPPDANAQYVPTDELTKVSSRLLEAERYLTLALGGGNRLNSSLKADVIRFLDSPA